MVLGIFAFWHNCILTGWWIWQYMSIREWGRGFDLSDIIGVFFTLTFDQHLKYIMIALLLASTGFLWTLKLDFFVLLDYLCILASDGTHISKIRSGWASCWNFLPRVKLVFTYVNITFSNFRLWFVHCGFYNEWLQHPCKWHGPMFGFHRLWSECKKKFCLTNDVEKVLTKHQCIEVIFI